MLQKVLEMIKQIWPIIQKIFFKETTANEKLRNSYREKLKKFLETKKNT